MKTQFSFGKNGIEVTVPEGFECQVIRSRSGVALKDEAAALESALDHPIDCEPLAALAAGKAARTAVKVRSMSGWGRSCRWTVMTTPNLLPVAAYWTPTDFVDTYIMPLAPLSCQFRARTRMATDTLALSVSAYGYSTPRYTRRLPA